METEKVLVVDDAPGILEMLKTTLEIRGYRVMPALNGATALQLFEQHSPDLVVLDLMLPDIPGAQVCRRIRQSSSVPVIVLSARDEDNTKINLLEMGADDYVTKPVSMEVLLARVRAVLRRAKQDHETPQPQQVTHGPLTIDFVHHRVIRNGTDVHLTPTEYRLLKELVTNPDMVLEAETLLDRVWGHQYLEEREYLRVYIRRLRQKLEEDPNNPRFIITEPRLGYRFLPTL